jgi:hypothetical protein
MKDDLIVYTISIMDKPKTTEETIIKVTKETDERRYLKHFKMKSIMLLIRIKKKILLNLISV